MRRLIPSLILAAFCIASISIIHLLHPDPARAQSSEQCTTITTTTYIYPTSVVDEGCRSFGKSCSSSPVDYDITSGPALGSPDGVDATLGDRWTNDDRADACIVFASPHLISGTARVSVISPTWDHSSFNVRFFGNEGALTIQDGDPWGFSPSAHQLKGVGFANSTLDGGVYTLDPGRYDHFAFCHQSLAFDTGGIGRLRFDALRIEPLDQVCEVSATCYLVSNAHFSAADGWTLTGDANIADGYLNMNPTGQAAQNVTLLPSTDYTAVISVTNAISPTTMDVSLGDQTETLNLSTQAETYTATFATPANLAGPLTYELSHTGAGTYAQVSITYTCLEGATDDGSPECIAPNNGTFDGPGGWHFYREAAYNAGGNNALMPYNEGDDGDRSLILSAETYTMPTIITDTYLLMSFTAQSKQSQNAVVAGRVSNTLGPDETSFFFDVYPAKYTYEVDISNLEDLEIDMAFANSGHEEAPDATADFFLDNVCIFLSDSPADLPEGDDGLGPVDLGFEYTCDDVDGILAYFGVNIQQYRAEYEAGASLWDPSGWVPWLIAAMWNILATYACLFVAAFSALVDVLEYILANGLNIGDYFVRLSAAALLWLGDAWTWLLASLPAIIGWLAAAMVQILIWFYLSGGNVFVFVGYVLAWFLALVTDLLGWLWSDLIPAVAAWMTNVIIPIVNLLIPAWDEILVTLGGVWGALADVFIKYIWNSSLIPFLTSIIGWLSLFSLVVLFIDFILAAWSLFKMLALWLWENLFATISIPVQFYYAFDEGINSTAFSFLMACSGSEWWCFFLGGMQMINQVTAHSIVYPVVIVGIIIATILIFWRLIWSLATIDLA